MDENHQDKIGNKQIATDDVRWVLNRKSKLWVPEPKKLFAERMGFAGKGPWDFIQLLLIPLVLLVIGSLFSYQQNQASLQSSQKQHDTDLQIAADQQQETILRTYLDNMSNLLLKENLGKPHSTPEVRLLAREQTLTTLRRLDAKRNQIVLQFLQDGQLIDVEDVDIKATATGWSLSVLPPVIDFSRADLSEADLRVTNLNHTNLADANLNGADLSGARLVGTILADASLSEANLHHANLSGAYLYHAYLYHANLSSAFLSQELSYVNFFGADLRGDHLDDANLSGADLKGANLSEVSLYRTILKGARYNTKEILTKDRRWNNDTTITVKLPPTKWPQGFDPKAAGAIEDNTANCLLALHFVQYQYKCF